MNRASGVLMHISTLFGDYSVGSFGQSAEYFVNFLAESGFSYWQVLPFNMADDCNSPYKSFGAFSGNPNFIDLDRLYQKGFVTREELLASRQNTPYSCEFERLACERMPLLCRAASRADDAEKEKIAAFMASHPQVADFCRFMALKQANDGREWNRWTVDQCSSQVLFCWHIFCFQPLYHEGN